MKSKVKDSRPPQKVVKPQEAKPQEEIAALKRMVASRDAKIDVLAEMVRRGAREMRAGGQDLLADLAAELKR